jgi:hypothetical protein
LHTGAAVPDTTETGVGAEYFEGFVLVVELVVKDGFRAYEPTIFCWVAAICGE